MNDDLLKKTTIQLLGYLNQAKERFEMAKSSGEEGDFYSEVKPFADLVRKESDTWKIKAIDWINEKKPLYINDKQIDNTCEHLEKMSIQCFYPKTSRKQFLNYLQSAQYVLQNILNQMDNSIKKEKV